MDPGSRSARDVPRWGAASGVAVRLLWAPMGVVVLKAPDLWSSADIRAFYAARGDLVEVVAALGGAGFLFFLSFLGTLMATLRRVEPRGPLRWVAFAGALMFTTWLNVVVSLHWLRSPSRAEASAVSTGAPT
jgi:hypothetical protein